MVFLTTYVSCSPATASHLLQKTLAKDKVRGGPQTHVPRESEMTDLQYVSKARKEAAGLD